MFQSRVSTVFSIVVLAFCAFAYLESELPLIGAREPSVAAWIRPEVDPPLTSTRIPKPVDGLLDMMEVSGTPIEGGWIVTTPYSAGLEMGGWMVLPKYRRPLFRADVLKATVYNDEHRYTFVGRNVDRADIARLFSLPTAHLGFRFRMDFSDVAPGEYKVRIERPSGSITPNVTLVKMTT